MDRNAIVAEIRKWQGQYNAYKQKITQDERDIEKLEHIRARLREQLNNFMSYLQKRRNKLNKYAYLTSSSRIAERFIKGMQSNIDGADSWRIANNLNHSVDDVSSQIKRLENEIDDFRGKMNQCANNYNYWVRQLQAHDAAAAAGNQG